MDSPYPIGIIMCQSDSSINHLKIRQAHMKHSTINEIKTVGIDLAKDSFALVAANAHGEIVLSQILSRKK